MANQIIPQGSAQDAFAITASDSVNVVGDVANTKFYTSCFVHNPGTSGVVKVTPVDMADGSGVTIWISQGATSDIAVKRVWATPAPPAGLIAMIYKQ